MLDIGFLFKKLCCINKQVSSAVPEGKGVSSSASVEVATMSAIAYAHGNSNTSLPPLASYIFHLYSLAT